MLERRDVARRLGYVGPALSVGLLTLATLIDSLFSWRSRSLSSMGEATGGEHGLGA
jgi:hypothetical membrane protein